MTIAAGVGEAQLTNNLEHPGGDWNTGVTIGPPFGAIDWKVGTPAGPDVSETCVALQPITHWYGPGGNALLAIHIEGRKSK